MADKYSTIQQHQPLRVPSGWGKQEKALIVQLDEVFDDIYRRFGRLRMEDMGEKFRKRIEDDEGNIASITLDISGIQTEVANKISKTTAYQTADSIVTAANGYTNNQLTNYSTTSQTADAIALAVGNCYGKVSGITINTDGIDLSGSKYVKIESGCTLDIRTGGTFTIQSGNFGIDSFGNVTFKGSAEISSGKSLTIKSGGTFSIDSSNFAIDSSGNVSLKGGVEIISGKDLKVKSGGNFKVESGGTFDVSSTNFTISSADKKIVSGIWKFDDNGMYCTTTNADYNFAITKTSGALPNKTVGIVFEADSTASYASGTLKFSTGAYHGSDYLTGTLILSSDLAESKLYPNDDNQMYLGISGKRFKDAYLYKLHCSGYYVASLFDINFSYSNVSKTLSIVLDTTNQWIHVGDSSVRYRGVFMGNADTASEADILKWQAPPSYNFNNLTSTGQYVVGMSNMTNSPTGTGTGYIEVIAGSTNILQRVFTKGSIYIREYNSDYGPLAWTAWRYVSLSAV